MKNCNKIIKNENIIIKRRNIKVEYKNLHGNCNYVGLWDKEKITIDSNLSPEDAKAVKSHEAFHAALCIMRQSMGDKGIVGTSLCGVCTSQENDPLFESLLIEYGIGYHHPDSFKGRILDVLWYQMLKIMRISHPGEFSITQSNIGNFK